jgi:hypothetical protein
MADTIANFIVGVIQAIIEALITHTGATVLAFFGRKSNSFVEAVIGLLVWALVAIVLVVLLR